jgi:hypothetical protein
MLDGMNAGDMAGLTFDEIAKKHPHEYAARKRDKLLYRWPGLGGEGYVDLIVRLRPLIVELERTTDCLIMITHRAVVRVLLTYFLGIQRDDLGEVQMPRETVYCFDVVSIVHRRLYSAPTPTILPDTPLFSQLERSMSLTLFVYSNHTASRSGRSHITQGKAPSIKCRTATYHFYPIVRASQ